MKNTDKRWLLLIPVLCWTTEVLADYKHDIGYDSLKNLLANNTPTGANVKVTQVESSLVDDKNIAYPIYAPNIANSQFAGKTFNFPGDPSTTPSGHATGVGTLYYGNNSIASGINQIISYEANDWLISLENPAILAPFNGSRIANHSWVGNEDEGVPKGIGTYLRLVDRQVQQYEFIQVAGMANSPGNWPLLGSAYNVIAVGRTDGGHDVGSDAVDTVYTARRPRPDLVAPQSVTSNATPIVSAAAALLVETGNKGASALSTGSTNISNVGTVYNAERAETIKAALMAGADRQTANTSTTANITDYRNSWHQTSNGLDNRFGAGQLNVLHSYQLIAAGEQDSLEDGGRNGGLIDFYGFDYDASFGGSNGSNSTATYKFDATGELNLAASLVWNLNVSDDLNPNTTLYNLNLELIDTTAQTTTAFSSSVVDNSENLWINLVAGHSYELLVKSAEPSDFSWDYALAWRITPVPLPGALYLFASAATAVGFSGQRKLSLV